MVNRRSRKNWAALGAGAIFSTIFGYLFWKMLAYGQRLWRQPILGPLLLPLDLASHSAVEAKALHIASNNLQAGIEKRRLADGQEKLVLCAGIRNFREPWARDLGFASFGLIEVGQLQAAKEALEVFLIHQRDSGQFPVKVHSTNVLDRYLHSLFKREQPITAPIRPKYITAHNTISLDGNAILITAILHYVERSGDEAFLHRHWPALNKAIDWLETYIRPDDGLLHQAAFADWADSIARPGRVIYPNVLFWKALTEMANAATRYGYEAQQTLYQAKADAVKAAINQHFWRPELGYFVTSQQFDNLSSSGNLLAIAWDLTTPEQAHAILDRMREFEMANPVPTQVTHRPYPLKFIAIENRLAGIGNYHTSAAWLWLGSWHIIALARVGRLLEAEELLYRLSKVIVRDGAVHEVYAPNGNYLSSFWYTSEAPLTWSAGMVVYAHHVYNRHLATARDNSLQPEMT